MKKFELTEECITFLGRKLFRIKALVAFGDVDAGDLGGYVEKEENLSHEGDAWVYGNAKVFDDARVFDDAKVFDDAWVCNNARVCDHAWVCNNADYATAKGFGSRCRTTTFFRTKTKGVAVKCGCFLGTLDEFREKVKSTHGESKLAKEHLMLADLMEYRFSEGE